MTFHINNVTVDIEYEGKMFLYFVMFRKHGDNVN